MNAQGFLCSEERQPEANEQKVVVTDFYDAMQSAGLSLETMEDKLLQEAVRRAGGNLAAAARALGMTRPQLSYRLSRTRDRAPTDNRQ